MVADVEHFADLFRGREVGAHERDDLLEELQRDRRALALGDELKRPVQIEVEDLFAERLVPELLSIELVLIVEFLAALGRLGEPRTRGFGAARHVDGLAVPAQKFVEFGVFDANAMVEEALEFAALGDFGNVVETAERLENVFFALLACFVDLFEPGPQVVNQILEEGLVFRGHFGRVRFVFEVVESVIFQSEVYVVVE